MSLVHLIDIVYDVRARDGTWCTMPYPDHPNGCPNFPDCIRDKPDFKLFSDKYTWSAVVEEFDLAGHAAEMLQKHSGWSERQCRNLLYWQGSLMARLRLKAKSLAKRGDILLELPEAHGVFVITTMAKVGINIVTDHPDIIRKVMFVGRPRVEVGVLKK